MSNSVEVGVRGMVFKRPGALDRLEKGMIEADKNGDEALREKLQYRWNHIYAAYEKVLAEKFYTREPTELDETISEYVKAMNGEGEWTPRALEYREEAAGWMILQTP